MNELPIVDAHQHFWDIDRNCHPWLRDEPIPFRYGDYSALRRNYLPQDYRRDTDGFRIVGTVYVEAEWDPRDPVGETRWVHHLAAHAGLPTVMVCQARLDRPDVDEVLAAQQQFPLVRGVRHKPRAAPRPDLVAPGAPGSMGDPAWRRGFALLAPLGLSFDLQTPWWHFREALDLAEAFPETQIIVNHTGLPAERTEVGLHGWRAAMRLLSAAPNVAIKISGLGIPGERWTAEANGWIVLEAIAAFGTERCMFASNFPVDGLVASFEAIFGGFQQITEDLSGSVRSKLFQENAVRIYRMSIDPNSR
jgi:predicted TIM-barrel fold metal-dependent hydrolase